MTYGLMGTDDPSASSIPPTIAVSAKPTDSSGTTNGEELIRVAAAAGVTSRASTSRAPTICTLIATASPRTSMNTGDSRRTGTPRAAATSASREANSSGRHMTSSATRTTADRTASDTSCGLSTATICPVSRPNLFAARPW